MQSKATVRTPEESAEGLSTKRVVHSASVWIPKRLLNNYDLLLRAGTLYGYSSRDGTFPVQVIKETDTHVILPRMFPMPALSSVSLPAANLLLEIEYDRYEFKDGVTPRDEKQQQAWDAFAKADCGVLSIACGGGKTSLALKKIAQRGYAALVIVSNSTLVDQWVDRATTFLGLTADEIGIVRTDTQQWDRPLVIAMMHTLISRKDSIPMWARQRFGTVVWDEIQHLSAPSYVQTADMFFGNRFGLSATPTRSDRLEKVYFYHVGPIFHQDIRSELYAKVMFKRTNTVLAGRSITDYQGRLVISKMYNVLRESKDRNELIIADVLSAVSAGRRVLILGHGVEHLQELAAAIYERTDDVVVDLVTGVVSRESRRVALAKAQVICATFSLAREGLDVPSLDTLFLVTPFRDWGGFQQAKGRVERAYKNKLAPIVVMYDDILIKPAAEMCKSLRREMGHRDLKYSVLSAAGRDTKDT